MSSFLIGQEVIGYQKVTIKPIFPGCENVSELELEKCNSKKGNEELGNLLSYPEGALNEDRSGMVYIRFIISKEGKVINPKVLRSSNHKDLDRAAFEAVSLFFHDKKITPGKVEGKPVAVSYQIPVNFSLEQPNELVEKLTTEQILNRLENMTSPDFNNTTVKVFSEKYIRFVKGVITGFYLKDRRVIDDWELFFKEHKLNEVPYNNNLTEHDKTNLNHLLEDINYIKLSIN